jgi:hypothetical protein
VCLVHQRSEATGVTELETQSPSERWDGDCVLRLATFNRFGSNLVPDTPMNLMDSRRYRVVFVRHFTIPQTFQSHRIPEQPASV